MYGKERETKEAFSLPETCGVQGCNNPCDVYIFTKKVSRCSKHYTQDLSDHQKGGSPNVKGTFHAEKDIMDKLEEIGMKQTPDESMKCSTKFSGSETAALLKVGRGKSFKPSKLRPCISSVRLRSSATSKLGWAPNEANTPPVLGIVMVTHMTGNCPPREASLTTIGKPCSSSARMPSCIVGYFAITLSGTSGKTISSSMICLFTARSKISDKH